MTQCEVTEILKSKKEAKDTKTYWFKHPKEINPGQFYMIWIPDVDEIPMSVSYIENDVKGITFRKVGEATKALYNFKKGDKIGIRGPFGNGFKIKKGKSLFVGGGTGIAMIAPTVEKAVAKNIDATVILGAKNKEEMFFEDRVKKSEAELHICTDDGSLGEKSLATERTNEIIKEKEFSTVYTCGPEVMMKKLFDMCKNVAFQASLERYMKCGVGLCGQCCIGEGLRVCKEGPVFEGETLKTFEEFGRYKRDASGKKISI